MALVTGFKMRVVVFSAPDFPFRNSPTRNERLKSEIIVTEIAMACPLILWSFFVDTGAATVGSHCERLSGKRKVSKVVDRCLHVEVKANSGESHAILDFR